MATTVKPTTVPEYIHRALPFAQPILQHVYQLVHRVCPEVEEKLKWGMPCFSYRGEMLCHMAAFKEHCVVGFWKAALMKDPILMQNAKEETAMGHLGKISSLKDLPSDAKLTRWIKEAMVLNEQGIKVKRTVTPSEEILPPSNFLQALTKNKAAKKTYEAFSVSAKKEYLEWITEAKTHATQTKRIEQAILWMAEGKRRHWKYQR